MEKTDSSDARVAPEMMSEAENRSGRADRESTEMRPDWLTLGKPDHFVCKCAGDEGLLCRRWCGDKKCKDAAPQVDGSTERSGAIESATPAGSASSSSPTYERSCEELESRVNQHIEQARVFAEIDAHIRDARLSALREGPPRNTCPGCFSAIYDGAAEQGWCCDCMPKRNKYEKEAYGY